jgi:hypothetical protein
VASAHRLGSAGVAAGSSIVSSSPCEGRQPAFAGRVEAGAVVWSGLHGEVVVCRDDEAVQSWADLALCAAGDVREAHEVPVIASGDLHAGPAEGAEGLESSAGSGGVGEPGCGGGDVGLQDAAGDVPADLAVVAA